MVLMSRYPDNYFDLAIVDLEYCIGASKPSKKPHTVKQKNGNVLNVKQRNYAPKDWDMKKSSPEYLKELFRVSKNQIVWGGNYYGLEGGYLVWDKLNGETDQFGCEMAWLSFTKRTDIVYYLWSGMFQGEYIGNNVRKALVQKGDKRKNEARIHPTQKPIPIYIYQLQRFAKPNDKILDTHLGSASIAIAVDSVNKIEKMNLELTACELDKEYFDASIKRINEHTRQLSLI